MREVIVNTSPVQEQYHLPLRPGGPASPGRPYGATGTWAPCQMATIQTPAPSTR